MDAAIAMSAKSGAGIRFVTLDGEIINASGAITGGNTRTKPPTYWREEAKSQLWRKKLRAYPESFGRLKKKAAKEQRG